MKKSDSMTKDAYELRRVFMNIKGDSSDDFKAFSDFIGKPSVRVRYGYANGKMNWFYCIEKDADTGLLVFEYLFSATGKEKSDNTLKNRMSIDILLHLFSKKPYIGLIGYPNGAFIALSCSKHISHLSTEGTPLYNKMEEMLGETRISPSEPIYSMRTIPKTGTQREFDWYDAHNPDWKNGKCLGFVGRLSIPLLARRAFGRFFKHPYADITKRKEPCNENRN